MRVSSMICVLCLIEAWKADFAATRSLDAQVAGAT